VSRTEREREEGTHVDNPSRPKAVTFNRPPKRKGRERGEAPGGLGQKAFVSREGRGEKKKGRQLP